MLDYLDKSGLAKNTVVIYASDQGFYLGEHGWFDKRFIYEESMKTPLLVRYPGVVEAGKKRDELVLNIDWAPTVLDIAGATIPTDIQGTVVSAVAEGRSIGSGTLAESSVLPLLRISPAPSCLSALWNPHRSL